jgi:hypothetical protein
MTTVTELAAGNFKVVRDGIRVFETLPDLKAFALVPGGKLLLSGYSFTFANPTRDLWYHHSATVQTNATTWVGGCASYTALLGEEWGPGRTHDVADVLLGDMPPYTDYVDARIKLTRTHAPANIMGNPIPTICAGEWSDLQGGATVIEGWPSIFVREMALVLDHPGEAAVKCYLRLMTSIRRLSLTTAASNNATGWRVGSSNLGVFGKLEADGDPSTWTDIGQGPPPANWLAKGGTSPCKSTVSGDWSSTYTGDIEITPGRVSAAS